MLRRPGAPTGSCGGKIERSKSKGSPRGQVGGVASRSGEHVLPTVIRGHRPGATNTETV